MEREEKKEKKKKKKCWMEWTPARLFIPQIHMLPTNKWAGHTFDGTLTQDQEGTLHPIRIKSFFFSSSF